MSTADTEELNSAQMLSHPSPLTNSHSINPAAYQPPVGPGGPHIGQQPMHNNYPMPPNQMRGPSYRPLPPHLLNQRSRTPFPPRTMTHNSGYNQPVNPSSLSQSNSADMNVYLPLPSNPQLDLTPSQNVLLNPSAEADNVRKVERFLLMLISLAKQKGRPTHMLMQCLVQNLLLGYISEEDFMQHLEQEMDCPPQDKLLTLLKRNMPSVRQNFFNQNPGNQNLLGKKEDVMLDQQRQLVEEHRRAKYEHPQQNPEFPPTGPVSGDNNSAIKPSMPLLDGLKDGKTFINKPPRSATAPGQNGLHTPDKLDNLPIPSPSQRSQSPSSRKYLARPVGTRKPDGARKKFALSQDTAHSPTEGEPIEDEDDSDITVMANIDLQHERQQMAPTQTIGDDVASIQDRTFLPLSELYRTINIRAPRYGIDTIEKEACILISHALEERIRDVIQNLSEVTSHRNTNLQASEDYEATGDIKHQLRAIERVDQSAVENKLDREKKMLIKVSKQRMSKSDDPEVNKMKEFCKKLKKEEEESIRKMAADVTALKMTGSRKKWSAVGPNPAPSSSAGITRNETERGARARARQVRITMKDFGFYMSQEREKKKSIQYYKALLK
ncbi:Transcription initiation factor TFIID subunit 4-like isoform X1 [Oopsacas minuta]|uniref:Transcription initiation factor TFIID subunit 4-like isoform X1 n=1 Tax=Oopsacas minuta TaxID=111878 RepID=A0AAV7KGM3_9METZ|nr:Transcription initiation factor TFIID subunit 4-like isoform X1 [Oopsacas minuta]